MSKLLSFSIAKTLFLRRLGKVQKNDARGLLVVTVREQDCINDFDPAKQVSRHIIPLFETKPPQLATDFHTEAEAIFLRTV